jgi:hypothetical protein
VEHDVSTSQGEGISFSPDVFVLLASNKKEAVSVQRIRK